MNNFTTLKWPLEDRSTSSYGKTKGGIERMAIFIARSYSVRDKKNINTPKLDRETICSIALPVPGGLMESMQQDWGMGTPLSVQSIIQQGKDAIDQKLGGMLSGKIQTSTGYTLAPAQELLYNGPQPRTIDFNYDLIPASEAEMIAIKNIVSTFKRLQSPVASSVLSGWAGKYLATPCIWEIKIAGIDSNEESEFLTFGFKDRSWAITSISINYSPEGNWSAFHNGFPVRISLTVSFAEMYPLTREASDDEMQILQEVNSQ